MNGGSDSMCRLGQFPTAGDNLTPLMRAEYARAGLNARITIAPVGKCWVQSAHKQSFYSSNGNHASVAGSAFAAKIIARTIVNGKAVGC